VGKEGGGVAEGGIKWVEISTAYIPQRGGDLNPLWDRKTETCNAGRRRVKTVGKKKFV